MSGKSNETGGIRTGVRSVLFGASDPRLRATWRFLLAWPLLPVVGALVALVAPPLGLTGMIPGGPLQVAFFLLLLVPWARYVDRRPLSDYGVSASKSWAVRLFVGVLVTVAVWSGWYALASSLGWVQVEVSMTAPQGSLAFGLAGTFVSVLLNTWVQDVVFFAVVLTSAAEGFRSRDVEPGIALLGGWLVALVFFTGIHGTPTALDFVGTALGGAVYGLLFVHTGDLALSVGVHGGGSYVVTSVFTPGPMVEAFPSVFELTRTFPDAAGVVGRIGPVLVTYLVLLCWLRLTRGEVGVETGIAEWTGRRVAPPDRTEAG